MSTATRTRVAAAAAEGRSAFVSRVVNDFVERTHIPVSDAVVSFILDEVLRPDDDWARGLKEHTFDPDQTARILTEALEDAMRSQPIESRPEGFVLDISSIGTSSEGPFYAVIHNRWKCPFPFFFC